MIKCNLAVLLAERGINVSEMSERTGLSRNTLSALQNNTGKGIQFDTMDAICKLLDVTPCQLFSYADIGVNFIFTNPYKKKIERMPNGVLNIVQYSSYYEVEVFYNESVITLKGLLNTDHYPDRIQIIFPVKNKSSLEKIPLIFRQEIFNAINEFAVNELNNSYDVPVKITKNSMEIKFLDDQFIEQEIMDFHLSQDDGLDNLFN
ncbi:helix-turn-helix domain-containing protein [Paenibacillus antarcticus]|uniref:HTH cro/C1-type domain-containing protein n=1 Tax=Paenibacillus antarcticus TaxID=253703 RepID=A0A168PAS1_9BACL|nr:helix-turn-helix transcriptional regulator [Paenibacillus antarcticus]OAB46576.1 hypothetical protein PBAT_11210 [Paenibacillus antarcticus]